MTNLPPAVPNGIQAPPSGGEGILGQSPGAAASFPVPNYYPHPGRRRPGIVTAVAIIALIFGAAGLLLNGYSVSRLSLGIMTGTAFGQSGALVALNLAVILVGLALSAAWIFTGIGLLGFKASSFKNLFGLSIVDVLHGAARVAVTFVAMPATMNALRAGFARSAKPQPPGVVDFIGVSIVVVTLLLFFANLILSILAIVASRRADARSLYLQST